MVLRNNIPKIVPRSKSHKTESRTHRYAKVNPNLIKKCTKTDLPCQSNLEIKYTFLKRVMFFVKNTKMLNEKQSKSRIFRHTKTFY